MIYGGGDGEGCYFDRGFLGDRARLMQCFYHAYLENLKNGGSTDCCMQQGFGHYTDQNMQRNR